LADDDSLPARVRQQFRRDIRGGRFTMDFAQSADSALLLTNWDNDLTAKIDASQNDARRGPLELPGEEFARRALFDPIAQSQELLFALVRLCPGHAFQIIHRLGADGASYLLAAIHHGKQHHHPIMFETSDAAAFKCHLVPLIFVLPTGD
jgi:hypothetical protein